MDAEERAEVRQMIHDVLSGWQARTESYMETTNGELKGIHSQFERLNGTVRTHQTVIDQNLPHTVAHCTQAPTIKKLEESMVTTKALNVFFWKLIAGLSGLATAGIAAWKFILYLQHMGAAGAV